MPQMRHMGRSQLPYVPSVSCVVLFAVPSVNNNSTKKILISHTIPIFHQAEKIM